MTTSPSRLLAHGDLTGPRPARSTAPQGAIATVLHQIRYDLLAQSRNREARFFAMAMPVGFLVLFCAIFGNATLGAGIHRIRESTYYVANLTTFGIVDVGFVALTIFIVTARESGVLRRRQSTPQPAWVIVASRTIGAITSALACAVVLLAIGRAAYGASVPISALLPLAVSVMVGCVAFVSLGFAAATIIRSAEGAQSVAMALSMPLFFISGVFVPWNIIPPWLHQIAEVFPIRHEAVAILRPLTTQTGGSAWSGPDLLVVAIWAVVGLVIAQRRFKWAPQDL